MIFFYTNADQSENNRDDLLMRIANDQPDIMLITEIIPKKQENPNTQALLGHGCFKSHIAEIKRFFIFVRRSGTSLATKCKHGSSLDISFLAVTRIL